MFTYSGISDLRYSYLKNLWVSPTGSDKNDGQTPNTARLSIASTVAMATPGTCVRALPGTYIMDGSNSFIKNGGNADTLTGYVALVSDTPHAAKLVPSPTKWTFNVLDFTQAIVNYFIVDGFDIQGELSWNNTGGSAIELKNGHHYKIINNILRDSSACGLQTAGIDYLLFQNNIVSNNAQYGSSHYSGISLVGAKEFDRLPGYHYIIKDNIIFANSEGSTITTHHTDGNGIILDNWANINGYTQQALIEGNLVFRNGHRGIEIQNGGGPTVYPTPVTIRNNTIFHNSQDPSIYGTTGEIALYYASGVTVENNVVVSAGIAPTLYINQDNNETIQSNNLLFNSTTSYTSPASLVAGDFFGT